MHRCMAGWGGPGAGCGVGCGAGLGAGWGGAWTRWAIRGGLFLVPAPLRLLAIDHARDLESTDSHHNQPPPFLYREEKFW